MELFKPCVPACSAEQACPWGMSRSSGRPCPRLAHVQNGGSLIQKPTPLAQRKPQIGHKKYIPQILVVEDQPLVRDTTVQALISFGYFVHSAMNGDQAMQLFQEGYHPDLVISDIMMPGMLGPEVACRLHALSPMLQVLFMSGYAGDSRVGNILLPEDVPFLAKPFTIAELRKTVANLLAGTPTSLPSKTATSESPRAIEID